MRWVSFLKHPKVTAVLPRDDPSGTRLLGARLRNECHFPAGIRVGPADAGLATTIFALFGPALRSMLHHASTYLASVPLLFSVGDDPHGVSRRHTCSVT